MIDMTKALMDAVTMAQEKAKKDGLEYDDRRYLPVKDRLEIFRKMFSTVYGIDTSISIKDFGPEIAVIASAKVSDESGRIVAAGHGMVFYGRDGVSKNSPVEAAETFAIGRALACLGLAGSEYASSNEMERIKGPPAERKPDTFAKDMSAKYHGMTSKEAEFRRAVDEAFPPKVGTADYFIPADNSPESLNCVYEEIDKISELEELTKYYTLLEESMQWMSPEDVQEIKATFKSRRKQIIEG